MKQEYNRLLEKAVPRMSDDELFNAVLNSRKGNTMKNNENKSRKRFSKAVVIPLAAALALGATAVGAVAVYNYNVSEEYANVLAPGASIFPQEYKNAEGEEVTQPVNLELYEQMNIALDKTYEFDGYTLEIPGAICDGKDMIVMFNVIFDENPKYREDDNVFLDYTPETEGVGRGCGRYPERIISKRGDKTVLSNFIELDDIEKCTADTVRVKLNNLWSSSMSEGEEGVRTFNVDLDIPLTSDTTQFNKTVDIPSKPHINLSAWGEWDMTDVEITPLSVTYNMKSDGEIPEPKVHKYASPDFPMIVTFKDGTTLDISAHGGMTHGIDSETKTALIKQAFNFPINVEDVQSVQIATAVINVDGTTETVEIPEINDHMAVPGEEK